MYFHAGLAAVRMPVGVAGCWMMLTRLLGDFLFGTSPDDPGDVCVGAGAYADHRHTARSFRLGGASRIDPISALRMS